MNRITKKFLALLLAVALLGSGLVGCGVLGDGQPPAIPTSGEEPDEGSEFTPLDLGIPCDGRLSIAFQAEDNLNPYTARSRDNISVAGLIYEGLYALGENFTAVPVLAQGLTTLDGRRYTLEIRNDIRFHDGAGLTIEDVIYSLNRARNSTLFGGRLDIISGYERRYDAQGERLEYEMDIVLTRVHGNIPVLLTFPIIQRGSFGQSVPPGTGPYSFTDTGGSARLISFPGHRYAQDLPKDTIYLAEIVTMEQLSAHFNAGRLDILALELTATGEPSLAATREMRHFEATLMDYIGFNLQRPETSRPEVRQAISAAINRAYVTDNIMRGNAVASPLPIHPSVFYYDHVLAAEFSFDLPRARQILAREITVDMPAMPAEDGDDIEETPPGVPPSEEYPDGEYEEPDDAPPTRLTLLVAGGNTNRMEVAVYIAASLSELGYQVIIDDRPYNEFLQALEAGEFDLFYGQVRLQPDFDLSELLFGSLAFGGTQNRIDHRLLDDFLASGQSDRAERASVLNRAILTDAPFAVIGFRHLSVATQRGVVIGMQPTQENLYNNVWEWIVNIE
ncbi:MAG: ABC transporter substrate-binding protein [Oscillospiraceae bacterium]|nr:ABC transporter substrate-binding protein [Oscillospiraceae bacterium]